MPSSAPARAPIPLPRLAIPGLPLAAASTHLPGPGTHIHDAQICASICGPVRVSPASTSSSSSSGAAKTKPTISVARTAGGDGKPQRAVPVLPQVGSECLCRVTRLGVKQAWVAISVVDGQVVGGGGGGGVGVGGDPGGGGVGGGGGGGNTERGFQGIIRQQDVRATEKDSVVVASVGVGGAAAGAGGEGGSFRVGDFVRGVVISLGDQTSYYLSTASNHLGVIMATSELGNAMYPISWKEFRDPVTGLAESRKVAKPF